MSKITLTTVGSLTQNPVTAQTEINSNFSTLQTAFDDTLFRDGTIPNQMTNNLDMNSNQIINLPTPATSNSALRLADLNSFVGGGTVTNIPPGGTTGQVLAKTSNTDYAVGWGNSVIRDSNSNITANNFLHGYTNITAAGGITTLTVASTYFQTVSGTTTQTIKLPIVSTLVLGQSFFIENLSTGAVTVQSSGGNTVIVLAGSATPNTSAIVTCIAVTGTGSASWSVSYNGSQYASGKLLTVNNSLTLAGTDGTTMTFPGSSDNVTTNTATQTLTGKTISGSSNTLSNVALSSLSTQSGFTLDGNTTSSAASPTAFTIGSLTNKAAPAGTDLVLIQDQAASGALKQATISSISTAGSVSSLNGQTGALNFYFPPQGRITLTSNTPVMQTSVSGATTVYYTPYAGNMVPIWNGTNIVPTATAQISQLTTDTTKSPAAVAASSVYDLFVWNDSGTIRCTRGPAWTNTTTRGYTFTAQNGILTNTSAITNGPGAGLGTWVGTIASNGSSTIDFIFGAAGTGGVAASHQVWNTYNRVLVPTTVTDNGSNYTYSSSTIRQARGGTSMQISFINGAQEDGIHFAYAIRGATVGASQAAINWGVGFNSTTAYGFSASAVQTSAAVSITGANTNAGVWFPPLGSNILAGLESSDGSNANGFCVNANNSLGAILRM